MSESEYITAAAVKGAPAPASSVLATEEMGTLSQLNTASTNLSLSVYQQYQLELQNLSKKITILEAQTSAKIPCGNSSNSNIATTYLMNNNPPTSSEFLKLCNRVDLLDGKINLMKKTLDEILIRLNFDSRILGKSFRSSTGDGSTSGFASSGSFSGPSKFAKNNSRVSRLENNFFSDTPSDFEDLDDGWIQPVKQLDQNEGESVHINDDVNEVKPIVDSKKQDAVMKRFRRRKGSSEENVRIIRHREKVVENDSTSTKSVKTGIREEYKKYFTSRYPPLDVNTLEKDPITNSYDCPVCHKPFRDKKKVERHYVVHSGERPFVCNNCQKTYTRKDKLTEHYKTEHPNEIPAEHLPDKRRKEKMTWICDCGKISANRSNHEHHMNACKGNKPHVCPTCERGFTQKSSLNLHISCVHKKLRRFLCDDCGKSFSISTSYQRHMRMHRGDKPFPCQYCDKYFSDKSDLRRHEKAHTGVKDVKCSLCELAFYKPYALTQHMKTHTGEKSFVCDECGKAFGHSGTLKKHKDMHLKYGDQEIGKRGTRKDDKCNPRRSKLTKSSVCEARDGISCNDVSEIMVPSQLEQFLPSQEIVICPNLTSNTSPPSTQTINSTEFNPSYSTHQESLTPTPSFYRNVYE